MRRRQLLDVALALATLADPGSEPTPRTVGPTDIAPSISGGESVLDGVHVRSVLEHTADQGTLRVASHPHPGDVVAAELVVEGAWGETYIGLTAPQARTIGQHLMAAAHTTEPHE